MLQSDEVNACEIYISIDILLKSMLTIDFSRTVKAHRSISLVWWLNEQASVI